ncbi:MAG: CAP domain-containing protein [Syntrophobacteraceae bacterium]
MKKVAIPALIFVVLFVWAPVTAPYILPPPSGKQSVGPAAAEKTRARELYRLCKRENRRLAWDACLSRRALQRAKELVSNHYFSHRDPATGKKPAWDLVRRCYRYRAAGENLAKGMDTSENIHKSLMDSPTHRKNIMDPRFSKIGIGCYDDVCVQLFAGF